MFSWLSQLETRTQAHTDTHTHTPLPPPTPLLTLPVCPKAVADAWLVGSVYSVSRFLLKEGRPWLPEAYWPGLLWTLPFFFSAHTIAKSVRNPKPAQFTFMNLWRQQAFRLLCGGLEDCAGGIPLLLIFLILQGFLNEPSIFFKARNWTGMCRNSSLLWVSHSIFLFHQHLFHKDRWRMCFWFEVIRKLILLRETQWERQTETEAKRNLKPRYS